MANKQDILNELGETAPWLAQNAPGMPYQAPAAYLDNLTNEIMNRIKAETVLPPVSGDIYNVPDGYFENLAGTILARIRTQPGNEVRAELEEIAPLLAGIGNENIYSVPRGYFEQLKALPAKAPAKVVPLRRARRWMQYAAAAVVSGVLVTGAFLYTDNGNEYRNPEKTDVSAELDKVSAGDLVQYLNNPEHVQAVVSETSPEVKNTIHTVTDEELGQYLTEHADDVVSTAMN